MPKFRVLKIPCGVRLSPLGEPANNFRSLLTYPLILTAVREIQDMKIQVLVAKELFPSHF